MNLRKLRALSGVVGGAAALLLGNGIGRSSFINCTDPPTFSQYQYYCADWHYHYPPYPPATCSFLVPEYQDQRQVFHRPALNGKTGHECLAWYWDAWGDCCSFVETPPLCPSPVCC